MDEPKSFQYRFNTLNQLSKSKNSTTSKQQIGLLFEKLIQDILEDEEILIKRGFHTNDNRAEQIDGVLEVYNRIILLEVKWVNKDLAASSLFSFIGKIENKFEGTIGLFVSRNKLSDNFIHAARKGRRQNVIVIDGDCIDSLINNKLSFKRYIIESVKYLSYQNTPIYPIASFLSKIKYENSSEAEKEIYKDAKEFIEQYIYIESTESDKLEDLDERFIALIAETKNAVYDILINEYQENMWVRGPSVRGGDFRYYYNFTERAKHLFENFPPSNSFLNDLALNLFTKKIPSHLEMYSTSYLINIVAPFYDYLDDSIKSDFEILLLKSIDDNADYYFENSITLLIEELWDKFSDEALNRIKSYYLDILFSSRSEKFKQKEFSIEIVSNGKVELEEILSHIRAEIEQAKMIGNLKFMDFEKFNILQGKVPLSNKELWKHINKMKTEDNK